MSTYGMGLSGGDRIFIELARRLGNMYPVSIYLWEEGLKICQREGLENVSYIVWSSKFWSKLGFFINYFSRVIIGIINALKMKLNNDPSVVLYSASEFWQDSLPAFILKLRYPKIKWIAAWYQTAPNPLMGFSEEGKVARYSFKAILYFLVQVPIKPIIENFADLVIVNNENEKKHFSQMSENNKIFVMLGAIDLEKIKNYQHTHKVSHKIYDGVFMGRFHPQKGVTELIDIWTFVTRFKPGAILAMIGDGPLMEEVKRGIKENNLEDKVKLFGYLFDGPDKYKVFSESRIVLHPALYDSGGMAAAEAMAFGIPVVGFDLKAYKSYYPKGMVKSKIGNLKDFAQQVLYLLDNPNVTHKIGAEGLKMLESNWSWDSRVRSLLNYISP